MIRVYASFAEQYPGTPEMENGAPTSEFRQYIDNVIAASDQAAPALERRNMAFDASPPELEAEEDPNAFFNGVTYAEGLRRYEKHRKRTSLPKRAAMHDEAEAPIGDLLRDALRGMNLL